MPRRPSEPERDPLPAPADFVRDGDYADRFLSDALSAVPKAPLRVIESIYWLATGRGVRARNRLQEIVGRRLAYARPNRLRPLPCPPPPAVRPRCTAIVPIVAGTPAERMAATLSSIPDTVEILVARETPINLGTVSRAGTLELPSGSSFAALVTGAARACDTDILLILTPGDVLLPGTADALAVAFARPGVEAAYADEVISLPELTLPLLKPDFDEELLLQVDYVGPFLAIRREAYLALGGYLDDREGALAKDILLRLSASRGAEAVHHMARPIHGRQLSTRQAGTDGSLIASAAHLLATGANASAKAGASGRIEITRGLGTTPPVSVIVPTRDRLDLLVPCLDGLLARTEYPDLEVIVADNDSQEAETRARLAGYAAADRRLRVAPMPGPFNFSRINNDAVALSRGEVVVFVNNDVEVMEPGWLRALVAEAVRPEVGAVGAKLLYPDGLIQHAGVVLGLIGGPAGHAFHLFRDGHPGYLHMLDATRRCSAVTAACLAVSRAKFEAMGGFDAEAFPVALNDVDLCLRLDAAGYRNLYVPKARLLHKESASRPHDMRPDQRARYERELAAFTARWPHRLARDPWYNPGHGQANADFSVPHWTSPDWPAPTQ